MSARPRPWARPGITWSSRGTTAARERMEAPHATHIPPALEPARHRAHPAGGGKEKVMSARVPRRALPALVFITMLGLGVAGLRVSAVGTTRYVSRVTCPQIGSGTQANPYCWIQ